MKKRFTEDIEKVLFTESQIAARVKGLAEQLMQDYEDKDLLMVGVLTGAAPFYTALVMEMDLPLEMHFIRASSYGAGTESSGKVELRYDLEVDLQGRDVVIVEDIIDSGNTLSALKALFLQCGANSVACCCLLDKKERRTADIEADYVGFEVPDEFLVGYGLDYAGKYRNLKYVGTLRPEVYSN